MHAKLLLSHDIFSFEKKPTICGRGRGGREVEVEACRLDDVGIELSDWAGGSGTELACIEDVVCVSESGGV